MANKLPDDGIELAKSMFVTIAALSAFQYLISVELWKM